MVSNGATSLSYRYHVTVALITHLLELHDIHVAEAQEHGWVSNLLPPRLGVQQRRISPGVDPTLHVRDPVVVELQQQRGGEEGKEVRKEGRKAEGRVG